jgi:tyrosyl-tRNA synthetase
MDNAEWLTRLGAIEFMRDVGKHFTVNVMLGKESVRARMEAGISYTEFSYMLLQAYDFLELRRREGVALQIGGSDQWGNIVAGIELIRRVLGDEAHGLTLPLITTAAGTKFGKSEAGAVWLDPARTSPYKFYQFWINVDDRDAPTFLRYFTLLPRAEVEALDREIAERPERREAQRVLAHDVTARVHGEEAARVAAEVSALLFGGGDPASLSLGALDVLRDEIPFLEDDFPSLAAQTSGGPHYGLRLLTILTRALGVSGGAARRLLSQGGIYVNGRRLGPGEEFLSDRELLHGQYLLLRKGARNYHLVSVRAPVRA